MNDQADHLLTQWLFDGPDAGPRDGLERALAATRRTPQRPGWTFLERWIPVQLTMRPVIVPRTPILLFTLGLLVAALVAAMLIAGAASPRPAPPFGLAANGQIAYDSRGVIVLANADGSAPRPVSMGLGQSFTPTFSPDGTRIAFLSRTGDRQPLHLWVANADGTNARDLAPEYAVVTELWASPAWRSSIQPPTRSAPPAR